LLKAVTDFSFVFYCDLGGFVQVVLSSKCPGRTEVIYLRSGAFMRRFSLSGFIIQAPITN
jgi:hypothetical protein